MVRKMVIVLAAAAAVISGSTFDASAARMGGARATADLVVWVALVMPLTADLVA